MKRFLSIVLLLVLAPLSQNWASELTKDSGLSQSTSADSGSQIKNTLQLQDSLNNEIHPLQVHEAFPLSVVAIDDQTLVITWLIKEDYYLYKDKMSFVIDGAKIANINFPEAKLKQDEFFGQVRVYEKPVEILVTLMVVNSNRPSWPHSTPKPDCLVGPKGICGPNTVCWLIQTVPVSSWSAIF